MKLSEVNVGDTLAYSTKQTVDSLYHISKAEVIDTTPDKWHKGTVLVRFNKTRRNWTTNELETYHEDKRVALRFLVGDYTETKHNIELREKDREIARLQRDIESQRRKDLLQRFYPEFKTLLGIGEYSLKWSSHSYELRLSETELRTLYAVIQNNNRAVRAEELAREARAKESGNA